MISRPATAAPILAVLAIVLVTLGAYVGGYFWLGELRQAPITVTSWLNGQSPELLRVYPHQWQARVFWPAAKMETWLRGETIKTDGDYDL